MVHASFDHRFLIAAAAIMALAGCANRAPELAIFPEALELATNEMANGGYPSLSDIPPAPTGVATDADWLVFQRAMVAQGAVLLAEPLAQAPPAGEPEVPVWAQQVLAAHAGEARLTPPTAKQSSLDWVDEARRDVDNAFARLPPL